MSYVNQISGATQQPSGGDFPTNHAQRVTFFDYLQSAKVRRFLMVLLCSIVFSITIISFRPFDSGMVSLVKARESDIVNQIGYLSLFAVMLFAILTNAAPGKLESFLTPSVFFFFLAVVFAVLHTPSPLSSARGLALAIIAMFISFALLVIPDRQRSLRAVLIITSMAVLTTSYAGLVLFPNEATHGYDSFEPQHSGLWRGSFSHKNIAGPIFSVITIFGIYVLRASENWGGRVIGLMIALLAFIFVINTGSKTTTGFLPLSIIVVLTARLFASPRFAVTMIVSMTFVIGLLTIATVYSETLHKVTGTILSDPSFTGRLTLWRHGMQNVADNLILGFGYNNFWGTDLVKGVPLPPEAEWDFRGIVHGHNNYIDSMLFYGLIGASFIFLFVYVLPCINYVRAYKHPENRRLADMFMMIIAFVLLISFMETFILWRADPIWVLHIFAVLGLHMLAHSDNKAFHSPH